MKRVANDEEEVNSRGGKPRPCRRVARNSIPPPTGQEEPSPADS